MSLLEQKLKEAGYQKSDYIYRNPKTKISLLKDIGGISLANIQDLETKMSVLKNYRKHKW